jgi:hypothetical protein
MAMAVLLLPLVIVDQVEVEGVSVLEPENQTPVAANDEAPEALWIAAARMSAWRV